MLRGDLYMVILSGVGELFGWRGHSIYIYKIPKHVQSHFVLQLCFRDRFVRRVVHDIVRQGGHALRLYEVGFPVGYR